MEWIPKYLDNLDSSILALHQSWAGYYRWIFLRFMLTVAAVTAMVFSSTVRWLAIAGVATYVLFEVISWFISRRRRSHAARSQV